MFFNVSKANNDLSGVQFECSIGTHLYEYINSYPIKMLVCGLIYRVNFIMVKVIIITNLQQSMSNFIGTKI